MHGNKSAFPLAKCTWMRKCTYFTTTFPKQKYHSTPRYLRDCCVLQYFHVNFSITSKRAKNTDFFSRKLKLSRVWAVFRFKALQCKWISASYVCKIMYLLVFALFCVCVFGIEFHYLLIEKKTTFTASNYNFASQVVSWTAHYGNSNVTIFVLEPHTQTTNQ